MKRLISDIILRSYHRCSNCCPFTRTQGQKRLLHHRRRLHGGDGGDRPHGQKVVGAMPSSRPHRNFVMSVFWNSKMSQFLHVDIWFNPFANTLIIFIHLRHGSDDKKDNKVSRPVDCLGALLVTWLTHAAVWSCAIGHAVLFDCWRRSDQTCLC